MSAATSRPRYTGDFARDELTDELIRVEQRVQSIRGELARRLEHGVSLRGRDQRARLRALREALAERGVLRDLQRELDARECFDDELRGDQ